MKDYYYVACNDLLFFKDIQDSRHYNNVSVNCQQIAEKLLKSVCELFCSDEEYKKTHSLSKLYSLCKDSNNEAVLDKKELAYLTDFYFDARYPGDDYIDVSESEAKECIGILKRVVSWVSSFRESKGLDVSGLRVLDGKSDDLMKLAENISN